MPPQLSSSLTHLPYTCFDADVLRMMDDGDEKNITETHQLHDAYNELRKVFGEITDFKYSGGVVRTYVNNKK